MGLKDLGLVFLVLLVAIIFYDKILNPLFAIITDDTNANDEQ